MTGTGRRVVRTGWCTKTPSDQRHPKTNQGPLSFDQGAEFVSNRTPSSRHASLQPPTLAPRRISPGESRSGGAPASTVCGTVLFSLIARTPRESTSPIARANTRANAVVDTVERDVISPSLLPLEPPQFCRTQCANAALAAAARPAAQGADRTRHRGRCGCQCCRCRCLSQPSATVADCL